MCVYVCIYIYIFFFWPIQKKSKILVFSQIIFSKLDPFLGSCFHQWGRLTPAGRTESTMRTWPPAGAEEFFTVSGFTRTHHCCALISHFWKLLWVKTSLSFHVSKIIHNLNHSIFSKGREKNSSSKESSFFVCLKCQWSQKLLASLHYKPALLSMLWLWLRFPEGAWTMKILLPTQLIVI